MTYHTHRRAALVSDASIAPDTLGTGSPTEQAAKMLAIAQQAREALQDAARDEVGRMDTIVLCRAVALVATATAADIANDIGIDLGSIAETDAMDSEAYALLEVIEE